MDYAESKYFDDMLDTFSTDGWRTLMEDLEEQRAAIRNVEAVQSSEDLYYRKGQLAVLNSILGFENLLREQINAEGV